jgi:hypothetical protein
VDERAFQEGPGCSISLDPKHMPVRPVHTHHEIALKAVCRDGKRSRLKAASEVADNVDVVLVVDNSVLHSKKAAAGELVGGRVRII